MKNCIKKVSLVIIDLVKQLSEVIQINNTLNLLGFKDINTKKVEIDESDTEIHIHIILDEINNLFCPHCGVADNQVKRFSNTIINHKHFVGKECIIKYRKRRYLCNVCYKSFLEPNPFAYYKKKISDETVFYVLNELKQNQSFTDVANKAGISTTEVIRIFDKHVDMSREKLPRILGIDEFKNLSNGRGKYACILTSIDESKVVDVLEDRTI